MKTYGLTGQSLLHSFSKDFFNKKFLSENISARYLNFEIENISYLRELFIKNHISGLNVTIPYKEKIIPYLDSLDNISKSVGAVNTILPNYKNNKLISLKGFNTDVYGFHQMIKPYLTSNHSKALILGTGGASKAVAYVLKSYNIDVNYISRKERPNELNYFTWKDINNQMLESHNLIINTTPIGMYPNKIEKIIFPYEFINSNHLIIDLVYNPSKTFFLLKCEKKNAQTLNGYQMLVHQALKSWNIWNNSINIE